MPPTTLITATSPTAPVVFLETRAPEQNYRFFRVISP
jgi:hypothetical protein